MKRILQEFGVEVFLRILILLVGMFVMSLAGWFFLSSILPACITAGGLITGWLLREQIVRRMEIIPVVVKFCLAVYVAVLLIGKRLHFDYITMLSIITAATALIFNLQFWSRSDPRVIAVTGDDSASLVEDSEDGT